MTNRILGVALWFGAIWFGYEILWSVTDVPRVFGPVVAAAVVILITRNNGRLPISLRRQ